MPHALERKEEYRMEQKNTPEMIWQYFAGSRIVLAGVRNNDRELFSENLGTAGSQNGSELTVLDGDDQIREGDYVLLFARTTVPSRKRKASEWKTTGEDWTIAAEDWEETLELLEVLQHLPEKKPAGVLLISGNEVYGKSYGFRCAKKETELGYVCHTGAEDAAAQCMRTVEQFACRLASEKELPVRIVRINGGAEIEELRRLPFQAMRVLMLGVPGEIYNISGKKKTAEEEKSKAPAEGKRTAPVRIGDPKIVSFQDRKEEREDRQAMLERERSASYSWLRENDPEHIEARAHGLTEYEIENGEISTSPLSPMTIVTDTTKAEELGK